MQGSLLPPFIWQVSPPPPWGTRTVWLEDEIRCCVWPEGAALATRKAFRMAVLGGGRDRVPSPGCNINSLLNWLISWKSESESHSVMSNSLQPHGQPHGILQARILEWVAFPFSRGSSQLRDWTQVSCIAGEFFTSWATKEALNFLELLCKDLGSCCKTQKWYECCVLCHHTDFIYLC